MKKTHLSLFICIISMILLCGCKFNLSKTKYLDRPDVVIREGYFEIIAPYISNNTESITIYRQNAHDQNNPVERVAIVYPKGIEDTSDQTMHYDDKNVLASEEYRYYLRFTDKNGERNRTEWSEKKTLQTGGAPSEDKLLYSVTGNYIYDPKTMILSLSAGGAITPPDSSVITDIDEYKAALVLQAGDLIQAFEVPGNDPTSVHLKAVLPEEYLYTDVTLLGILGQKIETNSKNPQIYKCVRWTNLTAIEVKNSSGNKLESFRLEPEYGEAGFDYSTKSDNENLEE